MCHAYSRKESVVLTVRLTGGDIDFENSHERMRVKTAYVLEGTTLGKRICTLRLYMGVGVMYAGVCVRSFLHDLVSDYRRHYRIRRNVSPARSSRLSETPRNSTIQV